MSAHHEKMQERTLELFRSHEKEMREDVAFTMRLADWVLIHGHLQLALRHPEATGRSRLSAERLVAAIEAICLDKGVFDRELIDYLARDQATVEQQARKGKAGANGVDRR
ncbi:MAG: hypothetical protein PHC88_05500 [Terrimicrobiaceae bacterium]|nr:hypothetical protein [Terrimicrobiaceae bacterium]